MREGQPVKKGVVAVIFVSQRSRHDADGYAAAAAEMSAAAARFPGYVGVHSTRGEDGMGITVSYWENDAAARAWKEEAAHTAIREKGRATWYEWYDLIVAEVTRSYSWAAESALG
ncbi:MAG TPA: antibiotic biosynthesis monooxygenase [Gemmatimonadaceae bacterium]|nr:antibiotic biosynthesis monooxygenase [Gemmatimonadaceae bacterium]